MLVRNILNEVPLLLWIVTGLSQWIKREITDRL